MKRILIFYMTFMILMGCEKDETMMRITENGSPAEILNTTAELSEPITAEMLSEKITFDWQDTDYGVTTEVSYTLEIDVACNNFSNPVVLGATTNSSIDFTFEAYNAKLLTNLLLPQHEATEVSIRVNSKVNGGFSKTSDPVTFTIIPYSAWSKGLWLISNSWTTDKAPAIYAKSDGTFDGYVYLTQDQSFKFTTDRTCNGELLGGAEGTLSSGGAGLSVGTTGYYRIKADLANSTYELTFIESFGAIGSSTAGGWNTSTALSYNEGAQTWEGNIELAIGALKFRANNGWGINYGPADGSTFEGTLLFDDPGSISIDESGNYTIVIDFSKKKSPDFTYSLRKNAAVPAPTNLWLPGGYQGWSPGTAPVIKSVNSTSYEGFVYISAGTGFKFTSAPDWDHINYGDSGTPGVLTTDGAANGMGLSEAGYYRFKANTATLTWSADLISSMGMVGPATLGGSGDGWNQSVAMTYSIANDVWTATIDLAPGALKFRANNAWNINYGPADTNALSGSLIFDDPGAINITEAGNYTVTLDFSRSEAPYKYTYSIVKN